MIPKAPISPISAAILIALDSIWGTAEVGATGTGVGVVSVPFLSASVFFLCLMTVTFLQRYVAKDEWGEALAKGFACGVLAGVPFPVMGTASGAALLGWAGMHSLSAGSDNDDKKANNS